MTSAHTLHHHGQITTGKLPVTRVELMFNKPFQFGEDTDYSVHWVGEPRLLRQPLNSETLLAHIREHGDAKLWYQELSGSFSLIVHDKSQGKLVLVNDHMGVVPCFYTLQQDVLYVSDTLKLLKAQQDVSCTMSNQALFNYFYFHCIPAPHTIYQECSKLEPGVAMLFTEGNQQARLNCYSPAFSDSLTDVEGAQKACLDIVDQAVADSVSDSCGAFLSGGLDSSTVAGMLARHQQTARTFSVGFKAKAYDETEYALITAKHFGTEHEVFYLEPEDASGEFTRVAQYFDEPFGNSSAMAAYFCAKDAKSKGVTRLLAGDGGDELFAGNVRYAKQKKFEIFHQAPSALQAIPRALLCNAVGEKIPVAKKVASYIRQADIPLPQRLETYNFINQFGVGNIFDPAFLSGVDPDLPEQMQKQRYDDCESTDTVNKMLYLDWKFTLADNDLVKVSKMCELAGVEVRYPLLEKSLVDFSATVPAEVKLPGYDLRAFYKNTCKGFLADDTLTKSKHGFGLPFGVWMKENQALKELTMSSLEAFKKRGILKASLIEQALEAHETVHAGYYGELIWIIVVLELWLQGQEG